LFSTKGRKIKTRLYGAIWHGAFMACFAYNACLEGGSNVQVGSQALLFTFSFNYRGKIMQ
jgi:hypothetical protein